MNWQLKAIQLVFGLLERVSPAGGGRLATRLWFTPRRAPLRFAALDREAFWIRRTTRRQIATPAGEVSILDAGRGPTVLLIHGWGGWAAQLGGFINPLVDAGYRVIAIDLPAHGKSNGKRTHVMDVEVVLRHIAHEYGPVEGVVAHSFGALVSTISLRNRVDLSRMVYLAPATAMGPAFDYFADLMGMGPRSRDEFRRRLAELAGPERWSMILGELPATRHRPELLVIHDPADRDTPFTDSHRFVENWPDSRLIAAEGVGHHGIVRDEKVIEVAVGFLTGAPLAELRFADAP